MLAAKEARTLSSKHTDLKDIEAKIIKSAESGDISINVTLAEMPIGGRSKLQSLGYTVELCRDSQITTIRWDRA